MTVTPASTSFVDRHIGARRQADVDAMLKAVGYDTVDALVDTAVPKDIRQDSDLALAAALSEVEVLAELRKLAVEEQDRRADDRAGLLRHAHPAGDPPQHPRSPGLVHRVHARTSRRSPRAGSRRC